MTQNIRCVILGAGGHGRVVLECIRALGQEAVDAFLDENHELWGTEVDGVPVPGGDGLMPEVRAEGTTHFIVGLGALGDRRLRRRLFEQGVAAQLKPLSVVHPAAICSTRASIGQGTLVGPGAIVNVGASIGKNVILNSGSIVEHDCNVSSHTHIASGACLGGGATVGSDCLIGALAVIRHGITIGEGVVVGAGSVVLRDVSHGLTVVGIPASEPRHG